MKLNKIVSLIVLLVVANSCQLNTQKAGPTEIIPLPKNLETKTGFFNLNKETTICFTDSTIWPEIKYLSESIINGAGYYPVIEKVESYSKRKNTIYLELSDTCSFESPEGYHLNISSKQILITAKTNAGIFYGIQTLWQIIPVEFHKKNMVANLPIQSIKISDEPRFPWRGMLLDCGRHFMEVDFIKRYLDLLALHKMNRFHWHLTEDQGWRIEIKKYPKLCEHGAWRIEEDGTRYGGFYTQEEIKEIVAYAKERHIEVIPEIELPGHSVAAISSYPNLSCTADSIDVANRWGVFKDIYCAGKESTFEFIENVMLEVIDLFPFQYIHIGGDEAPTYRWENCSLCQQRIREEKLNSELELQSYFIKRVESFLLDHDRQIIGWDEILEGGLSPQATVQAWRGFEGAIEAAHQHHYAIVSPTSHAYFDYSIESLDLKQVYSFNPIPAGLEPEYHQYILGGECNMWTERAPQNEVDDRMFPRLLAMSEALWSGPEQKDFPDFHSRVQTHYRLLDALDVKYGLESKALFIDAEFDPKNNLFQIELLSTQTGYNIFYTLDGSTPENDGILYEKPILLDHSAHLIMLAKKDDGGAEHHIEQSFFFHKAIKKPIYFEHPFHTNYPGNNPGIMTNGLGGSLNFRDGEWQGFFAKDIIATIDLENEKTFSSLSCNFLQSTLSWIYIPKSISVFGSSDGENFELIKKEIIQSNPQTFEILTQKVLIQFEEVSYRFVKMKAENFGNNPLWHDAAGADSWLFADEIIIL